MSKIFTKTMFENLKQSLNKNSESSELYKNILKTEPGNTYLVRLLPNTENVEKSFFRHIHFGWISYKTGKYISALSPTTYGEEDPIEQTRYKLLYRSKDDSDKVRGSEIKRSEKWLANVYVIDDPVNKDNNGKVMILRFGKQLYKIIESALIGEASEDFGARIFDLSKDGCNLKIKVDNQGEYPNYTTSRFTSPKEIAGLDEKAQEKIYKSVYDLEKVYSRKNRQELTTLLDEHFYNRNAENTPTNKNEDTSNKNSELVETKTEISSKNTFGKKNESEQDMIKGLLDNME